MDWAVWRLEFGVDNGGDRIDTGLLVGYVGFTLSDSCAALPLLRVLACFYWTGCEGSMRARWG
jgi:hypothetical protein